MRARSILGLFAVCSFTAAFAPGVVGCAVETDPGADEAALSADEAAKKACPVSPAICTHGGRCGSIVCKAGQVCEPGAKCPKFDPAAPHPCDPILDRCVDAPKKPSCSTVKCASGTHCEIRPVMCLVAPCPEIAECVPNVAACAKDGDCRLFDDYCTGCDCRALSTTEKDPVCKGPGVRCLREPCGGLAAHCDAGKCVAG
jgi:hypothetical protein